MDENDWIKLYERQMPSLYRAVSRRVGARRELAEDVTQEAWLRALRTWWRDGVPADPAAWLLAVASNLLRNHFRDEPARAELTPEAVGAAVDAEGGPAEERAAHLQRGLSRLRPEQARLLEARHVDGAPLAEIAARTGLSERAVEGRLRRARAALEKHLDPAVLDAPHASRGTGTRNDR